MPNSEGKPRQARVVQQDVARMPRGYAEFLAEVKRNVRVARVSAALSVNAEISLLYWRIGRGILERQQAAGWGARVVDQLARDLRAEFPEMTGFSPRNLKYMRAYAKAYPNEAFVQQVVAQIPWGHNVRILDLVKRPAEREWYARQTIAHGWTRDVLVHQIESDLHRRQGKAVTNFQHTLPDPQSELAASLLKDPYSFDFLSLTEKAREQDLERDLLHNIRSFLLELGTGFAFVGSQHHLEVGGRDYFLDLLFYHLRLRCYVIIELKIGEFEPEHAGKMNFYLAAVDALLRHPTDSPSIGMILCKTKNKVVVEYALQHANRPMGVATYRVARALPPSLRGELPSPRELEKRLSAAPSADAAAIAGEIAESEADSDR